MALTDTFPSAIERGAELRRRRQDLGVTQAEFAKALGRAIARPIHWNTLARWERGELGMEHPAMIERGVRILEGRARARQARQAKSAAAV